MDGYLPMARLMAVHSTEQSTGWAGTASEVGLRPRRARVAAQAAAAETARAVALERGFLTVLRRHPAGFLNRQRDLPDLPMRIGRICLRAQAQAES